jgi:hypothetical protein
MIGPDSATAGPIGGSGGADLGSPGANRVSVRLVDIGLHPLDVLGALSKMGCPEDLAIDYVEASVQGSQPEVLLAAAPVDASRVAEALRRVGATVSVEPALPSSAEPSISSSAEPSIPASAEPSIPASAEPSIPPSAEAPRGPSILLSDRRQTPPSRLLEVDTVERYLAAYNDGDEASLLSCLSVTAVLSDATGVVLVEGADAIGRRMADLFEHYPDRRVTVLGRLVAAPWVLDHHRTTFGGGASEETIMCFRVVGALIERLVLLTMT